MSKVFLHVPFSAADCIGRLNDALYEPPSFWSSLPYGPTSAEPLVVGRVGQNGGLRLWVVWTALSGFAPQLYGRVQPAGDEAVVVGDIRMSRWAPGFVVSWSLPWLILAGFVLLSAIRRGMDAQDGGLILALCLPPAIGWYIAWMSRYRWFAASERVIRRFLDETLAAAPAELLAKEDEVD